MEIPLSKWARGDDGLAVVLVPEPGLNVRCKTSSAPSAGAIS